MKTHRLEEFVRIDNETWSDFLMKTPGFQGKHLLVPPSNNIKNGDQDCQIWSYVKWATRSMWKSIDSKDLEAVQNVFDALWKEPKLVPVPMPSSGLDVESLSFPLHSTSSFSFTLQTNINDDDDSDDTDNLDDLDQPAVEMNRLDHIPCERMDDFFQCDNATFTLFLSAQPGFLTKRQLYLDNGADSHGNCSAWTSVHWSSRKFWKNISIDALNVTQKKFVDCFHSTPTLIRLPNSNGLNILQDMTPKHPTIVALAGMDVVAYHFLSPGDMDVPGSPNIKRFLNPIDEKM